MENEYQIIINELKELKEMVSGLRKELKEKDKKIDELKELILNGQISDKIDSEKFDTLNSADPETCYDYALKNPDCDIKALSKKVIESGNLHFNNLFMKNIKGCLFDEHLELILSSKDPQYCYHAALLKLGKEKSDLIRKIIVQSNSVKYCYEFANDIRYIYDVADDNKDYDFLDISDLERVIIDNLDIKYSYMFAKNVDGANIDALQQLVLDLATADDIDTVFNFGVDIREANLNNCKEKIVELYNQADTKKRKEIVKGIDECEKDKIKCLFRRTFADPVVIE